MDQVLLGAQVVGAVNLVTLFIPNLNSKVKVLLALVAAYLLPYIPFDVSPVFQAVEVVLASSGVYKVAQVVGVRK